MEKNLAPVINAMMKDENFLHGGIFSKEEQYAEKYDLTLEEIANIQTCLYYALNIKVKDYNDRVNNICRAR